MDGAVMSRTLPPHQLSIRRSDPLFNSSGPGARRRQLECEALKTSSAVRLRRFSSTRTSIWCRRRVCSRRTAPSSRSRRPRTRTSRECRRVFFNDRPQTRPPRGHRLQTASRLQRFRRRLGRRRSLRLGTSPRPVGRAAPALLRCGRAALHGLRFPEDCPRFHQPPAVLVLGTWAAARLIAWARKNRVAAASGGVAAMLEDKLHGVPEALRDGWEGLRMKLGDRVDSVSESAVERAGAEKRRRHPPERVWHSWRQRLT